MAELQRRAACRLKETPFQHHSRNLRIRSEVCLPEGREERQVYVDVILKLRTRVRQRSEVEVFFHVGHAGREINPELSLRSPFPAHRDFERTNTRP